MIIWKDKYGQPVEVKEFFSRWKQGIQNVTPLQQTRINLIGNVLVMIGVIIGIVYSAQNHFTWLIIVLIGSFLVTTMSFLGTFQRYLILSSLEKQNKDFIELEGGKAEHEQTRTGN